MSLINHVPGVVLSWTARGCCYKIQRTSLFHPRSLYCCIFFNSNHLSLFPLCVQIVQTASPNLYPKGEIQSKIDKEKRRFSIKITVDPEGNVRGSECRYDTSRPGTCGGAIRLEAGWACQGSAGVDLPALQQHRGDALEVVVAGQGDEQVEQETLAVVKHLWAAVVHAWGGEGRAVSSC